MFMICMRVEVDNLVSRCNVSPWSASIGDVSDIINEHATTDHVMQVLAYDFVDLQF